MFEAPMREPAPVTTPLVERMDSYRSIREQIERAVLPLATSLDGKSFQLQASLHGLALRRGGYVTLEADGASRLGQVTDLSMARQTAAGQAVGEAGPGVLIRFAQGEGVVLESDGSFSILRRTERQAGASSLEDVKPVGELQRC